MLFSRGTRLNGLIYNNNVNLHIMKNIISLTHNINIIYKWIGEILIEQW